MSTLEQATPEACATTCWGGFRTKTQDAYFLGPVGGACGSDDHVIPTVAECDKAFDALGLDKNDKNMRHPRFIAPYWFIPKGCTTRSEAARPGAHARSHGDYHFSTHVTGNNGRGDLTPVCRNSEPVVVKDPTAKTIYFGLSGDECRCYMALGVEVKLDDKYGRCGTACSGDENQKCGGEGGFESVYDYM